MQTYCSLTSWTMEKEESNHHGLYISSAGVKDTNHLVNFLIFMLTGVKQTFSGKLYNWKYWAICYRYDAVCSRSASFWCRAFKAWVHWSKSWEGGMQYVSICVIVSLSCAILYFPESKLFSIAFQLFKFLLAKFISVSTTFSALAFSSYLSGWDCRCGLCS